MNRLLSPFCLLLALVSIICAFALLAKGPPVDKMDLHRAQLSDDSKRTDQLKKEESRKKWTHYGLTGGLFVFSGLFAASGFLYLTPAEKQPKE